MASTSSASLITKASFHARSISLPSTLHPVTEQLNEQLARLRSSQSTSTSSSSLNQRLNGLTELYSIVDEYLQLPVNQHGNCIEATLDRSLRLIDICSTSRDILAKSKEHIQNLQSVLRRRCSGELSIASEAGQYIQSRKTAKKTIKKCLQSIKPQENDVVTLLTDVEEITVDTFKSLLSYLGGAEVKATKSRWSVVTKLVKHSSEKVVSASEFEALDVALSCINQKKKSGINMSEIEELRCQMVQLESEIEEFDEVLESLSRHLVKTRSSLLNILSY